MTHPFFLFLIIFLPFFSCTKTDKPISQKPIVLVSIPPYRYFAEKIAQDIFEIETLIPAGANPHIYEATPKEVQRHQNAAIWIYLGEPFDQKVLHFFEESAKPILIVDVTQGIELLSFCEEDALVTEHAHCHHGHDEGKDLHVWLSPTLAKQQAQKIAEAFIAFLPEQQLKFEENLQSFLNELDELDTQIVQLLEPMKGKAILVSHPAFGYFCRDYQLIQLSIETEGKDPLPQHLTTLFAKVRSYSIQTVLIEPQYSNKGAELIAQSLHLSTHMVDPYAENYLENLLTIAKAIAE